MDEVNKKILELLKENSRISLTRISKKVHLSLPSVIDRIKKLEEAKIILKYTILCHTEEQRAVRAFLLLRIKTGNETDEFRRKIGTNPFVRNCYHLAGHWDYLLEITSKNTEELDQFLHIDLKEYPGIEETQTLITLGNPLVSEGS